ncbi:MAG: hypothetical protein RMJ44_09005 [Cytophagales bacterium]|nr:hypothetical protein [Bernardetiaceae bacterium]MDW8211212.1 hypothetical protein [Cytophagales bacterium]
MLKRILFLLPLALGLLACSSDSERKFVKTPLDELIRNLDSEKNFTIILYDMDIEDKIGSDVYKHRYKIITMKDSLPQEQITDWLEVPESFFLEHQNNMGMEIASKVNGKLSKAVAPPGYSQFVGNPQYGQWRTASDGSSFWEFYGKYAMISNVLGLVGSMINRNSYEDYYYNYRGTRPYYGSLPDGRPAYGTYSPHGERANPDFYRRIGSANAFKEKVNSRVMRSAPSGRTSIGSSSQKWGSSKPSSGGIRIRRRR